MNHKTKTALITGASSGIGAELAKLFAADHYNLILVARNESALNDLAQEIKSQTSVEIAVFSRDLSRTDQVISLYKEVIANGYSVDALVNNAGFGLYGKFVDTKWERELEMINLNILALTHLTKLFLPDMVRGGIWPYFECGINCSVSAWTSHGCLLCYKGVCIVVQRGDWKRA